MTIAKTKVMVVDSTPIHVSNVLIETIEGYVYLRQRYRLKENNQDKEIQRRIVAGWAAYMPNTGISSIETLSSARIDRCTTPVCCQLWHMVHRHDTDKTSTEQTCH